MLTLQRVHVHVGVRVGQWNREQQEREHCAALHEDIGVFEVKHSRDVHVGPEPMQPCTNGSSHPGKAHISRARLSAQAKVASVRILRT